MKESSFTQNALCVNNKCLPEFLSWLQCCFPYMSLTVLTFRYTVGCTWHQTHAWPFITQKRGGLQTPARPHTQQLSEWPLTPRFVQSPFWLRVCLWNRLAHNRRLLSKIRLSSRDPITFASFRALGASFLDFQPMLVVSETFLSKMRHASPSGSLSISTLTLKIVTFLRTFRQYGISPSDFYLKLDEFNLSHSLNPYSLKKMNYKSAKTAVEITL